MATNLVQTINNRDKYIIYYDADVFNQNVTLSIHLTLPKVTNSSGAVEFSQVEAVEWNTIYEEQFGTNGSLDGQKTENFNVVIAPGVTNIAYQDYDFALLTNAMYAGTNGGITTNINIITNTVEITSTLSYLDYGTLTLTGQILNYYQTVNNIPQYIEQELSEIAVQIWSLPPFVQIIGEHLVPNNSTFTYSLPDDYDIGNAYLYQWRLRKIKAGDTDISNARAEIVGYTSTPDGTRSVVLKFKKSGFVNLEVIVYGPTGCPRIVKKQICVQLPLTKMLVIRNRLI